MRSEGLQSAPATLVFYHGDQAHGCHQKAIELLGIGGSHLRVVASDDSMRMRCDRLEAMIEEDFEDGRRPVCVIASAGTVNTGAIDPIDGIADICARYGLWLHVDGAYGAPAILASRYAAELRPIARADSLAVDPHKWLYAPVEAGLVLVRDGAAMRSTFSLVPPYLRTDDNVEGVGGPPWFSEYGFQQTRGFRSLKVWMGLRYHGLAGYRESIERDIELAGYLCQLLQESQDFEVFEPHSLSIVCFRYRNCEESKLDFFNKSLLERVQLGGRAFLSGTQLRGSFWLRACVVNPRARGGDIDVLVETLRQGVLGLL